MRKIEKRCTLLGDQQRCRNIERALFVDYLLLELSKSKFQGAHVILNVFQLTWLTKSVVERHQSGELIETLKEQNKHQAAQLIRLVRTCIYCIHIHTHTYTFIHILSHFFRKLIIDFTGADTCI